MKRKLTLIIVPAVFVLTWVITQAFLTPDRGPHGGELKAGNNYYIEMKHSMYMIQAYLLDEHEATLSAADLRCEVELLYADSSTYKVGMSRKGDQGFYGFTPDNYYTSSVVKFILGGREVSATFDNAKLSVDADTSVGSGGNSSAIQ